MTKPALLSRRRFLTAGTATFGASLVTPHIALANTATVGLEQPVWTRAWRGQTQR